MDKYSTARTVSRCSITKLISKIENVITDPDIKIDEINDNLDLLTAKEADLNALNLKIFELIKVEDLEKELSSVENYKENILLCKNKLNRAKTKLTSNTVFESNNISQIITDNEIKCNIKLPRLTIEQFDGDIVKWPEFWSRFQISIHENNSLSKVEKLSYLKSYLTKDAERAIAGLLTTNENYDTAIKTLKDRFGRKDLIIDRHMSTLLHMAPCRNSKDVVSLRKIYDSCDLQINALRSLGVEPDSYGTLLFPILIKALPNDIILLFTRNHSSDKNKITDLLEFLKLEVESRERASLLAETQNENNKTKGSVKPQEDRANKFRFFDNRSKDKKQSTAILNATTEKFCIFCDKLGNHVSDNCECYNVNQKKDLLKQNGRCFSCYKKFHLQRNCRSKIRCTKCHSNEHRKGLCDKRDSTDNNSQTTVVDSNTVVTSVIPVLRNETNNKTILMSTFKAVIVSSNEKLKVRCLLDSGSERTFIHSQICNKLNLPIIGKETINLNTFGSTESVKFVRSKFQFKLCNIDDSNKVVMIDALESPEICGAFIEAPSKEFYKQIQSLNIKLSDCDDYPQNIDVLIGSDYFWKIVTGKTKRLSPSLMLIETLMGWAVQGPVSQTPLMNESVNVFNAIISKGVEDENLTSSYIKSLWELESIGIREETSKRNISDNEAYQDLKSNLTFKDNRYEVKLPWKYDDVNLNDNYFNAQKRLRSLISRCKKDPNLFTSYNEVIDEYLKLGIVENVNNENDRSKKPVYYLPHHPVIRNDKDTTKLRIVFDASSHPPESPSLNDLLHPGPNLNPDLLNLLLKFRLNRIAFIADIEKAFLMISLNEHDRDAVRFLWVDNLPEDLTKIKPKILRMKRVLFGVTSSPFLLAGVIKLHLEKYFHKYPETCKMLNDAMYVDDLLSGTSNENEAFERCKESKIVMDEAGMTLRKWKSNSRKLEELWENSEIEFGSKEIQSQDKNVLIKVLGLIWDRHKDTFKFDVTSLIQFIKDSAKTKRTLIRSAGRIFDPMGFLSPFTMRLKLLFQELWEKGTHWDEELPNDITCQWDIWCEELPLVNTLEIPRYYFDSSSIEDIKSIQIHCFTDSSEKAYGAVIYLRSTSLNNEIINVRFLMSRSRLAPLKKLTIPRLELTAALIGARLISHIKPVFQNLQVDISYHCWTDSSIAISWIRASSSKWKPYVANRVREIQSLTDPEIWRHCPGQTNPADIITRKRKLSDLIDSDLWWSGPEWLRDEENWPKDPHIVPEFDDNILDLEARKLQISLLTSATEDLFDLKLFGTLNKTLRITAWIRRFINNLKLKTRNTEPLDANEISEAEIFWITRVQELAFKSERDALLKDKELDKDSKIKCFDPFIDERGLIRVGGRLQFAEITEDEKHPILLPYNSDFSALVVKSCHERVAHCGLTATLAQLRANFFVMKARKLVKTILNKCVICKRYKAKAFVEKTAPLPADRVNMCAAFDVTGIDFAGPLYIKENGFSRKAYICLFTCASVRAIHLELVSDLRTESFILAFKRFVGRRGLCRTVYSDNAATFKRADKELQRWLSKKSELQEYFGSQKIEWKYIAPLAAWWGGFWERLVRSVKSCLKKILGKALLTYEEMSTVLIEIEAILNSRPVTYMYDDALEPTPLTPSHFLVGHRLTTLPAKNCDPEKTDLRSRLKYQQTLIEHFWKRWKEQYLLELRSNHFVSPSNGHNIKINDIVLTGGKHEPRQIWQLGKVIDVYPGRDGHIRACAIKTPRGVIRRPIQLLYNLEIT